MTARQIQMEVSALHSIRPELLIEGGNEARFVAARNEAMYRCRTTLKMSYPQIGRLFRRHYTTVLYGVKTHAAKAGLPTPPNKNGPAADVPAPETPERLERALVRQAHQIASQASTMADLTRQIEALSKELVDLRVFAARATGQRELFAYGAGATGAHEAVRQ